MNHPVPVIAVECAVGWSHAQNRPISGSHWGRGEGGGHGFPWGNCGTTFNFEDFFRFADVRVQEPGSIPAASIIFNNITKYL